MRRSSPDDHTTIEDTGPRLVVTNPARRSIALILLLAFWLTFWTVGGVFSLGELLRPTAPLGSRLFMLVWLCGWAFGEVAALMALAWQLGGCETITVTRDDLVVERKAFGRGTTHAFDIDRITDTRASIVSILPKENDEAGVSVSFLRTGSGSVAFDYNGQSHRFGMKLSRPEAEAVAQAIREKLDFWKR